MTTWRPPLLASVLVLAVAACSSSPTTSDVDVEAGTVSNAVTGELRVWSPSDGGPYPVVMLLHDENGNQDLVAEFGTALAREGLTVFAPRVTAPRRQIACFYAVTSAAAPDHRGDTSRPITMVGHGVRGPYAIGTVIYEYTGDGDASVCFGDGEEYGDVLPDATLAVAVAPCEFDGPMTGLSDDARVVVVSAAEDVRCPPERQVAAVELFESADIDVSLVMIGGADHYSVAFQARQDNGEIVTTADSPAGSEVVQVIVDAIADTAD